MKKKSGGGRDGGREGKEKRKEEGWKESVLIQHG